MNWPLHQKFTNGNALLFHFHLQVIGNCLEKHFPINRIGKFCIQSYAIEFNSVVMIITIKITFRPSNKETTILHLMLREKSVKLPSVITSKIIFFKSFVWKARVSEIFRQAEVGSPSDVRQQ